MATSTKDSITSAQATHFFLGPETVRHRQYEALRAYFVGDLSTSDVAQRFGYSPVPSASSATASATTLTSGTRSSKHRSTVPVLLPHAIVFGNSSSPCANATYLSTTSNANWPTPVMTSVSTPSRSSSRGRLRTPATPPRRRTTTHGQARTGLGRRCPRPEPGTTLLPYSSGRPVPLRAAHA